MTTGTVITARDITVALRDLFPVPVLLSTSAAEAGVFLVRLPASPAASLDNEFGERMLARRLGCQVKITGRRKFTRRDCGRGVEFTIQLSEETR